MRPMSELHIIFECKASFIVTFDEFLYHFILFYLSLEMNDTLAWAKLLVISPNWSCLEIKGR